MKINIVFIIVLLIFIGFIIYWLINYRDSYSIGNEEDDGNNYSTDDSALQNDRFKRLKELNRRPYVESFSRRR